MSATTTTPSADLITAYLDHLREKSRSDRTIDDRRDILTRVDADLPRGLDRACGNDLAAWIYRDEWGPQTRATYLGAIRGFFRYHVGRTLALDPSTDLPLPTVPEGAPRPVTTDQLRYLLATARNPYQRWALIAARTGARCIEISRMDKADITAEVTYLCGKGGKKRVVPTHPELWQAAQDWPPGSVAVVDGRRVSERYIAQRSDIYFARSLGLRGVSMHRIRHWYLTYVHRGAGGDIRITQRLAGHSSPMTTARYVAVADADAQAAVLGLPDLTGSADATCAPAATTDPGPAPGR